MDTREENGTLVIVLSGSVDSTNYEDIEQETEKCIGGGREYDALSFDVKNVNYVSSAGLRMFSHFNQKMKHEGKAYSIINANKDLYKIFNVTGYTAAFAVQMAED